MATSRLLLVVALALPQSTPTGGAIAKFVPPVPTPASFISDQRRVLSDSAHRSLDARITALQRDGVGDIAVAIIPSIGDYSANQVAVEIYRTWRVGSVAAIGSERRNVGVLLLIVPKELSPNNKGECWINTGTGAEGRITDGTAGEICRNAIVPLLRNRAYDAALASGIVAIEHRLRGGDGFATPAAQAPSTTVVPEATVARTYTVPLLGFGAFVAILLFGIGIAKWRRRRPRKCPRCGRMMHRLDEQADDKSLDAGQRLEETLKSVDYDVWVCECGESKVIPYRAIFTRYSDCRECKRRTALHTYHVIIPPTTISSGTGEKRFTCKSCGAKWTTTVILPQISTSSSGDSGGGGGGGGGGSSFGGSGSTSGGGGGSSY